MKRIIVFVAVVLALIMPGCNNTKGKLTIEENGNTENEHMYIAEKAENHETNIEYIGNKNSKKYHLPSCFSLPGNENRTYFNSKEIAISEGYTPCKNCNP